MISDQELLILNKQGFIPGPDENDEKFLERVKICSKFFKGPKKFFEEKDHPPPFPLEEELHRNHWDWTKVRLKQLFDIAPDWPVAFYHNHKINFWQAAATWIFEVDDKKWKLSLLQLRKKLKRGSYFKIYSRDEILAHEVVHAARMAFDEPEMEEIFAYLTSSSFFRRALGPIVRHSWEVSFFLSLIAISLVCHFLNFYFGFQTFLVCSKLFFLLAVSWFFLGILRLIRTRFRITAAFKNLIKIFKEKEKVRAVLFRLTDKEIRLFSRMKKNEILEFVKRKKEKTLRWRMINRAYFQ